MPSNTSQLARFKADLLQQIEAKKADRFETLWEQGVAFMPTLEARVHDRFPDVSAPWELVPAYHALFGSTVRPDLEQALPAEVQEFIETEIALFVASV